MRRLTGVMLCLLSLALGGSSAVARPLQSQRRIPAAPTAPPFPWPAVLETVGPIVGIWLGSVLLRRTVNREKTTPPLSETASLPVAWFAAMSGLFEKKAPERKAEPPHLTMSPESRALTPDL
jgi:hypothetical protein